MSVKMICNELEASDFYDECVIDISAVLGKIVLYKNKGGITSNDLNRVVGDLASITNRLSLMLQHIGDNKCYDCNSVPDECKCDSFCFMKVY